MTIIENQTNMKHFLFTFAAAAILGIVQALQQCDVTMIGDTNFDGCIELTNLLDVLSGYGNCFD